MSTSSSTSHRPLDSRIHARAVVEDGAEVGAGCRIGPGAYVGPEVRLGTNVQIGPNVVLVGRVEVGDDVRVWPGAVLGAEPQDRAFDGEETGVVIGRGCQVRELVTVHRATGEGARTVIGEDVMLMGACHVAHNCRVGAGAVVANGALLAGHVQVAPKAFVSGNAVIHQFVRIGTLAMIGGASRVNRDVPPYGMLVGDSQMRGMNRVGVRRAGFDQEVETELSDLYRILRRSGPLLTKGIPALRERARSPQGNELVEFLEAPSRRGLCRF